MSICVPITPRINPHDVRNHLNHDLSEIYYEQLAGDKTLIGYQAQYFKSPNRDGNLGEAAMV